MDKLAKTKTAWYAAETLKTAVSAVVVSMSIGLAVYLYLNKPKPKNRVGNTLVPTVVAAPVEVYRGHLDLTVSGTVVPYREISLAAEVGGIITEVFPECEPGGFVAGGTPLMVIDRESYELEVKTAEAEVAQSKNSITETEKELEGLEQRINIARRDVELLQAELSRNTRLGGTISASELDQVKRSLLAAESQLVALQNNQATATARQERARSGLDLATRRLERAQLNLSKTLIKAPDTGVIVRKNVQQGSFVSIGTPLLTFEVTHRAEVICNLANSDLLWIRQNAAASDATNADDPRHAYQLPRMPVKIFDQNEPDFVWQGTLERYDGIGLDPQTKTIPVRIVVDQPVIRTRLGNRALVRGMFVKCRIETPSSANDGSRFLTVPTKSIRSGGIVWTVEDGKLRRHSVKVVNQLTNAAAGENSAGENLAVVRQTEGGLAPGAMVVVSPLGQPTEGMAVILAPTATENSVNQVENAENQPAEAKRGEPPRAG